VLILAVDTAGERVGVALGRGPLVVGAVTLDGRRRHAEQLVPALRYLFRELSVEPGQLSAIAWHPGAGSSPGCGTDHHGHRDASALRAPPSSTSRSTTTSPTHAAFRPYVAAVLDARRNECSGPLTMPEPGGGAAHPDTGRLA